jgi:B-box zinc finger protein
MNEAINPAAARRCAVHQQRPAYAVCMQCAKTLCQECATQWDGIWYCAACLSTRRSAQAAKSRVGGWIAVIAASLGILYLCTRFMVWSGVLLAGLR